MKAFEKYRAQARRNLIQNWPEGAPAELQSLSREQLIAALAESDATDPMPDAELTPELVSLRNAQREMDRKGFEALASMGRIMIELRSRFSEPDFWQWVEAHSLTREKAELAMEAATEQAP